MNKKTKISILSISSCFLISSIITACGLKYDHKTKMTQYKKKTGKYYVSNKHGGQNIDYNKYVNTNLSSVSEEESMFLEDLELKFIKRNDKNIAYGTHSFNFFSKFGWIIGNENLSIEINK